MIKSNRQPTMPGGIHKGKLLLVEAGQSVDEFKKEYQLDDRLFQWWVQNQLKASAKLGNLTNESWISFK